MKKLLIPTILAATILIAASFAFMPVERVTTTHLPSVGTTNIADDSITSAKIAADTIDDADVVNDGLDATSLAANSVGNSELTDAITLPTSLTVGGVSATATTLMKIVAFTFNDASLDAIETITDADVTAGSVIVVTIDQNLAVTCIVDNIGVTTFDIQCSANVADANSGQYLLIK